jgi:hypothetical protein
MIVRINENYQNKTVVYYHCALCGVDFRIEYFETNEEVFYSE